MDSPPPRFNEMNAPGSPRFTEHINSSPPYQPYPSYPSESPNAPQYGADGSGQQLGYRLSNKDRPLSPELMSPGLESVWAGEGEKEVAYPPPQPQPYQRPQEQHPEKRRICGMPRALFWTALILLLALAIGLGVGLGAGLGVGLKNKKSSPPSASSSSAPSSTTAPPTSTPTVNTEYLIGGAISTNYYSTTGAFNGSGIALASQSFSESLQLGTQGSLVMYFQHHTGEIRWQQLSNSGEWLGGSVSEVVAVDAKNSTPLSAVSYSLNGTDTWHIFYIDTNNQIKQRTNSNSTNVWVDGPINQSNLTANDADMVGMQACWYGDDYGDSDYTHTPLPGQSGDAKFSTEVGMHIWYASDDTTFQQLGWRAGDDQWTYQQTWPNLNGHAGVGCYSWGPGTVTYAVFVDLNDSVSFYWKDTNTSLTGSTSHPINKWVNSSIAINNVNPATSLGYTNYFYAQMADNNMVSGYNISWAAENTSFVGDPFVVQGDAGISGTHMSVSAIPNNSGGNDIVIFYQTNGSDISEYTRDLVEGQWTSVDIPIPES